MRIEEAVAALSKLRDEKTAIENELKNKLAPVSEKIDKLETALLNKMKLDGCESYKTPHGTIYSSKRTKVSCPDKSAFMDFIKANDMFELLEVRPLKSAVEEYKDGRGVLPPGIDYSEETTLNFRRAKA